MKKRYVLKKWVKNALFILYIAGVVTMFYLVFRITPKEENALNHCMKQGNSKILCEKELFGY